MSGLHAVEPPERVKKTYEVVIARDLQLDPSIQRQLIPSWVKSLVRDWDQDATGTVVVSRRADGSLWLIDGQHRKEAGLQVDPDLMLDAVVYTGLTIQEEAKMSRRLNKDRKVVNHVDNFLIGVVAGEEMESKVAKTLADRGLSVGRSASANKIAAVQALLAIESRDKDDTNLLGNTLDVAMAAFGKHGETWSASILRAIADVIFRHRSKIELDRLIWVLQGRNTRTWQSDFPAKGGGGVSSRSTPLVNGIIEDYDKRLGAKRRLRP